MRKALSSSRIGFLACLLALLWAKSLLAYLVDFSLGATGLLQLTLLVINPLGTSAFFLSLALFAKRGRHTYPLGFLIYTLLTILLVANVLYYREFTDFMTIPTVLGVSKVAQGLGASSLRMLRPHDLLYLSDILIVWGTWLVVAVRQLLRKQPINLPLFGFQCDRRPLAFRVPQAIAVSSAALFALTMAVAELNRPQLLTRTFDRNYIVKYLGLAPFTVYDGFKTAQTNQVRAQADSGDMASVLSTVNAYQAAPAASFGQAAGKNVIILHLESFQQFLIGMKVDGQEVTPFLNQLVKQKQTLSFDNFFHQVGLGRTSDAENMLETSTFGLPTGSLFSSLGSDNTFEGAPAILNQTKGYSSAVFHGGSGGFWNRNNVYKSLGYQYFFDGTFFNQSKDATTEYGIKDKLLLAEVPKYLEHLQQPFYTKIITTTNHFPFSLGDEDSDFPDADTTDATINGYFKTAHYLDQALREFFDYLKTSGLEKNTLVMMYGDHYGISNDRLKTLAPLIGKDSDQWRDYDTQMLQRVPLIFTAPGLSGGVNHTFGGEIDVLPTLLHLLGVNTKDYVQFGTDLLSPDHDPVIALRNHNYITPQYTVIGSAVYDTASGEPLTLTPVLKAKLKPLQDEVDARLAASDLLANKNLLRFYVPSGFTPVDPEPVDFTHSLTVLMSVEAEKQASSTSLYAKNNMKTTVDGYKTDAPELQADPTPMTNYPDRVANQATPEAIAAYQQKTEVTSDSASEPK